MNENRESARVVESSLPPPGVRAFVYGFEDELVCEMTVSVPWPDPLKLPLRSSPSRMLRAEEDASLWPTSRTAEYRPDRGHLLTDDGVERAVVYRRVR